MNTYIALLRGINVGGKNLLPMKSLIEVFVSLGLNNVVTYIQSGNVVFETRKTNTKKLSNEISLQILNSFGFKPKTIILEAGTLNSAVINNPYLGADEKALHYYFLAEEAVNPDLGILQQSASGNEKFELKDHVLYLYAPDGIGRSKLAAKIEKGLGVSVTARNGKTVNKIRSLIMENLSA